MTAKRIANFLEQNVNWNSQFHMMQSIGTTLNGAMDRFDMGRIIEEGVEMYSDNKIVRIDEVGRDHYIPSLDAYVEMKKTDIFTPVRGDLVTNISARLTNSLGGTHEEVPKTFDYLVLVATNGWAVIAHGDLEQYATYKPDGITVKIPNAAVEASKRYTTKHDCSNIKTYKSTKDEAIQTYLREFI